MLLCHDDKDGTFAISWEPVETDMVRGVSQLMEINERYMIVRNYNPVWTLPQTKSTYELQIYIAKKETQAEKHWYTDAVIE